MDFYDEFGWADEYLSEGERILWRGVPEEGHLLTAADIFLIPFSLMWGGFAIFWELTTFVSNAPLIFKLWGIPFVLVGLYLIFGRFIALKNIRRSTSYIITDRRVLRKIKNKVDFIDYRTCSNIQTDVFDGGRGRITFGERPLGYGIQGANVFGFSGGQIFALDNIAEVNKVYNLIAAQRGK